MNSRLQAVRAFGQGIWLDNLSRELWQSGALKQWIEQDGIAGVTSNPAIFHKAIANDALYQNDLAALKADPNLSAEARYEALVLPDIQATCDILLPRYRETHGEEGYVSLEVSPALAHDVEGTLAAARRLWQAIERPNAMIKIPATAAGIAALRHLIREGINVNITLLFSAAQVEATWDAYVQGLNEREQDGHALHQVKAVSSFFLSRIDSRLDPRLPAELQGKTALALARSVYQRYRERFHGMEFAALKAQGARPQYLLWASTGTKNPAYSDVLYVEQLIGAETINTVPDATLLAFRDHGQAAATLDSDRSGSQQHLAALAALGIDLDQEGEILHQEGLVLFEHAFVALLALTAVN